MLNQVSHHPAAIRQLTTLDWPKAPLPVARKWFPYTPDFDREFLFLEILNSAPNHGHDRIIKHLAVVIDQTSSCQPPKIGKHSLLFPLADLDLEKCLTTELVPNLDPRTS